MQRRQQHRQSCPLRFDLEAHRAAGIETSKAAGQMHMTTASGNVIPRSDAPHDQASLRSMGIHMVLGAATRGRRTQPGRVAGGRPHVAPPGVGHGGLRQAMAAVLAPVLAPALALVLVLALLLALPGTARAQSAQPFAGQRQLIERQLAALPDLATALVAVRLGDGDGAGEWLLLGAESRGGAPVTRESRFELGSVTKALTGSLLARMAAQGSVHLDDPVARWLPRLAGRPAGRLTLRSLATHHSGLPRVPISLRFLVSLWRDLADPYRHYREADLLDWLADWGGEPHPEFAYSNLGFALLGLALERAAGQPLARVMEAQILRPAGAGGAGLDEALASGQIAGHDSHGRRTPPWSMGSFAGAGALRANGLQMAALLDAARTRRAPFDAGAEREQARRHGTGAIGLGWLRTERHGDRIVWHNGGTGGFRSFIGYSELQGRGVLLMANGQLDLDSLGMHLINPAFAVAQPTDPRRSIAPWWVVALIAAGTLGGLAWGAWQPRSRLEQALALTVGAAMLGYAWRLAGGWAAGWAVITAAAALLLAIAMLWRGRGMPMLPVRQRQTWLALANAGLALLLLAWLW
jgi:CubicO group peptidase (beta-lactamase class C family)